ncbi:hypothetical protein M422DRAFT_259440 [Sphaerobolus stellatus SS14]|uniref:Uncharacterized protein n=1 Tax=Sphaerobolus stellatus (strain SS14) TaxID=990650 RepID=A0A0C9VK14_SPHS4|nr:hypothetical protein M422DRAFT_259440 [Sphaerobolus stellatus SS14]
MAGYGWLANHLVDFGSAARLKIAKPIHFTTAVLRQEIVNAIESIIAGCASNANVEFALCKQIYKVTTASMIPVCQRLRVLSFVSGGTLAAAWIRRWTAWSLLGGKIDDPEATWGDYPPLDVSENLFDKTEPGTVKFIDKATAAFLERICKSLERLMGRIVDTRAAHLERTFAEDSMNRLHKRPYISAMRPSKACAQRRARWINI